MAEPAIILAPQEIPDKLYFRIGEVAKLAGVKQYVLRFWETEFPGLGPKKSGTGHRLYRRKDVELVLEIKRLLYEKRFTIEGARQWLDERPKGAALATSASGGSGKAESKRKRSHSQQNQAPADSASPPSLQQAFLQPSLFGGPSPEAIAAIKGELRAILKILAD